MGWNLNYAGYASDFWRVECTSTDNQFTEQAKNTCQNFIY